MAYYQCRNFLLSVYVDITAQAIRVQGYGLNRDLQAKRKIIKLKAYHNQVRRSFIYKNSHRYISKPIQHRKYSTQSGENMSRDNKTNINNNECECKTGSNINYNGVGVNENKSTIARINGCKRKLAGTNLEQAIITGGATQLAMTIIPISIGYITNHVEQGVYVTIGSLFIYTLTIALPKTKRLERELKEWSGCCRNRD